MGTGIHLPTPAGVVSVDNVVSSNLELDLVVGPEQYAVIYEAAIGGDATGGGASPDLQLLDEAGTVIFRNVDVDPEPELLKVPNMITFPMGEDVKLRCVNDAAAYTAGSLLLCYGLGGLLGTGSGIPTPKCFDNAVNNGADREVVVTPAAGEHVVLFGANAGDDLAGTTTDFEIIAGGVTYVTEALAAPGAPDSFSTLDNLMAFPKGVAVTVRMTATTAGSLFVHAALVH